MDLNDRSMMSPLAVGIVILLTLAAWGAPAGSADSAAGSYDEPAPGAVWVHPLYMAGDHASGGPAWLDDELRRSLERGESVPVDAIEGFALTARQYRHAQQAQENEGSYGCQVFCLSIPYLHIRPGAALGLTQFACTANFVFENGDRLAIGTAGHCTWEGQTQYTLLVNPEQQMAYTAIGRTVFSTGNAGIGSDFALIEIDERFHGIVRPEVSLIDGPCGWGMTASLGTPMEGYGHGLVWGAGGQSRAGALLSDDGHALTYALAPGVSWGDSGSPAIFAVGSEAAAVTTHAIAMTPYAVGTSMPRVFELLDAAGHGGWSLVDSPNCL